jgi:acyl carrier protein
MGIQESLSEYILKELAIGRKKPIQPDEDLFSSGILDSLGVLQLVLFIEEQLGIQVPDEDVVFDNFKDIATIGAYLESRKTDDGDQE